MILKNCRTSPVDPKDKHSNSFSHPLYTLYIASASYTARMVKHNNLPAILN